MTESYFPISVSWVVDVVAVVGLRLWRESWRCFETPLDLLNDELDLDALWLLVKLFCCGGSKRLLNIVAVGQLVGRGCCAEKRNEKRIK